MSGPAGSSQWMYATGYDVDNSLRFNQPDDATLSKTFASAGNRRTWTFSCWAKIGNANAESGNQLGIFGTYTNGNDTANIQVDGTSGEFHFEDYSGSYNALQVTEAKLRDMGAWYHFMVVFDTTQGTAANRVKLYVNGTQMTTKTGGNNGYPDQNFEGKFNNTTEHKIGMVNGTYCWDGYLAEVNFIDGTALTPSSFGETGDYGEWRPIEYSGSYGTNGFYLNFKGEGTMLATGGTISTDGDYKVHQFTSSGTFTPTIVPASGGFVEYLIIGGGGSGGGEIAGGGGAGGYLTGYLEVTPQAYTVTVGAGGAERSGSANPDAGNNGEDSVFGGLTSVGGGGGGGPTGGYTIGRVGGSGGGTYAGSTTNGAAGTAGQGNRGGAGEGATGNGQGGGGGGAGAVGVDGSGNANTATTGAGGAGLASSITGSSVTRAGGGGGGTWNSSGNFTGGNGGAGGGGQGFGNQVDGYSNNQAGTGTAGSANTGGGGGGGGNSGSSAGGAGGSGIVIMRYKFQ